MDVTVRSFQEYHDQILVYDGDTVIFRGVRDSAFALVPKVGRPELRLRGDLLETEVELLRLFKQRALPYLRTIPRDDWEWLAIAQHHGLATRLLDWTRNPLVAAYFAVEGDVTCDHSAVYVYRNRYYLGTEDHPNPFEYLRVGKFVPPHVTERIIAQAGLFTIHPNPRIPFENVDVERILIPAVARRSIRHTLYRYGVHRASLFPGLDGLALHLNWLRRRRGDVPMSEMVE